MEDLILLLKKCLKIFFLFSAALFFLSLSQKDRLPDKEDILPQLYQDPVQTETSQPPFEIRKKGITYGITPRFHYQLYGLVVSYHHSRNWWDYYHGEWKDFINVKDLCVIWGENIDNGVYKRMKFSSGPWTCYGEFKPGTNSEDWSRFKNCCLSNNHLLSGSDAINKEIMRIKKGDQIYFEGYLVEYSHSGGAFHRGTSITRTDEGNGACETVFLTDLRILKKANPLWCFLYACAKYSMFLSGIGFLIAYFKSPVTVA